MTENVIMRKGWEAFYERTAGMYYPKMREQHCGLEGGHERKPLRHIQGTGF